MHADLDGYRRTSRLSRHLAQARPSLPVLTTIGTVATSISIGGGARVDTPGLLKLLTLALVVGESWVYRELFVVAAGQGRRFEGMGDLRRHTHYW
jgi:hypothetical protein